MKTTKSQFNQLAYANGFTPSYSGKQHTMFLTPRESVEHHTRVLIQAAENTNFKIKFN